MSDVLAVGKVHLGMDNVQMVAEHRRLAIEDVLGRGVIGLLDGSHTVEPHDLDGARAVGEERLQTALAALARRGEGEEAALELHCGLVTVQLVDMVDNAAVDIAEREVVQQVIVGTDAQLLLEQFGTFRSHAVQVLYVGMSQVRHRCPAGIRQGPGPWGA